MHGGGPCMAGGMDGRGLCGRGACMDGRGRAWHARHPYHEIRSMSRWYASYWNAFLFPFTFNCANFH